MNPKLQDSLKDDNYMSLTTYRRNGRGVATPVWFAPALEGLVVWTRADSWKVKRITNNPGVKVAPCTARGRITGPSLEGAARQLEPAEIPAADRALAAKYGLQYRGGRFFSRLLGRQTTFLLIR